VLSAEQYMKAVEQAIMQENLNTTFRPDVCEVIKAGNLNCGGKEIEVSIKGEVPNEGTKIYLQQGKIIALENAKMNGVDIGLVDGKIEQIVSYIATPDTLLDKIKNAKPNSVIKLTAGTYDKINFKLTEFVSNNGTPDDGKDDKYEVIKYPNEDGTGMPYREIIKESTYNELSEEEKAQVRPYIE
jgi:hypothetical protein